MKSLKIKRIVASMVLVAAVGMVTVGCTEKQPEVSDNNNEVSENVTNESTENDEKDEVENIKDEEEEKVVMSTFTIYSKDANTEEEVVAGDVEIETEYDLDHQLNTLAEKMSELQFDSLPIIVTEIKDVNGKKVAVIDLSENKDNTKDENGSFVNPSWYEYFQGSTGGSITEHTLITTMLQSDYTGEWIDGVQFTYEGESAETAHTPLLGQINYR